MVAMGIDALAAGEGAGRDAIAQIGRAFGAAPIGLIALFAITAGVATAATSRATRIGPYIAAVLGAGAVSGVVLYFGSLG